MTRAFCPRSLLFLASLGLAVGACTDDVTPVAAGPHLDFLAPPASVGWGAGFFPEVLVVVRGPDGAPDVSWTGVVTLSLAEPVSGVTLLGGDPVAPVGGVARFPQLQVTGAAPELRLVARTGNLPEVVSDAFEAPGVFRAAALTAGAFHTCALDEGGRAWCWGRNHHGQLGDGAGQPRDRPEPVAGGLVFADLTSEGDHTCGRTPAGDVYCWGANGAGQLGNGSLLDANAPVPVSLPRPALSVDAGYQHTCALIQGGEAWCWGWNGPRTLGVESDEETVVSPMPIPDLTFVSVTAGYEHTCGLDAQGTAYCWGYNGYGELGNGNRTERESRAVAVHTDVRFTTLVAGGGPCHGETCGISVSGEAYCWGKNYQRTQGPVSDQWASSPTRVAGDPGFAWITPGPLVVCGGTPGGDLYCWGDPLNGQLGNGQNTSQELPVRVLGARAVRSQASGWEHICAAAIEGDTWCWGRNVSGQLGNPSSHLGWMVPVPVWGPGG